MQEPTIKDFEDAELINPHNLKNRVWCTALEMGIKEDTVDGVFFKNRILVTGLVPAGGNVTEGVQTYYADIDVEQVAGTLKWVVNTVAGTVSTDATALVVKSPFAEEGYQVIGLDLHASKAPVPVPKRKSAKHKPKVIAPSTAQLLGRLNILKPSVK